MVQAYYFLTDFGGAAEAQRIVAADQPSSGAYGQLALLPVRVAGHRGRRSGGGQGRGRGAEVPAGRDQASSSEQIRKQAVKAEEAAGEGAEERAAAHHSGRQPAPEPVRRSAPGAAPVERPAAPPLPSRSPGPLAQLVEQEPLNLKVEGSSPSRPMTSAAKCLVTGLPGGQALPASEPALRRCSGVAADRRSDLGDRCPLGRRGGLVALLLGCRGVLGDGDDEAPVVLDLLRPPLRLEQSDRVP